MNEFKIPLTKEAMFATYLTKVEGLKQAVMACGETCTDCNELLNPIDIGTDVDGTRTWLSRCCGITQLFEQKSN